MNSGPESTPGEAHQRCRVALVFGGRSSEHSISCVSAASVLQHLDPARYEVVPIGISPSGQWFIGTTDAAELTITDNRLPSVAESGTEVALSTNAHSPGVVLSLDHQAAHHLKTVDVVFPILHGPWGEDGTIQGLFEIAGLPYVGSGVLGSAVGMDKAFMKKLFAAEGIPVGRYVALARTANDLTDEEKSTLGLPVFIKPSRGGSSIGISRVTEWADLPAAIELARQYDPKVIVEAAINGREIECGVLELPDGEVKASAALEIAAADEQGMYDFESKYIHAESVTVTVPADLSEHDAQMIRALAIKAFTALDCKSLARVDFFLTEDGPVINEINTMPGLTATSQYPRMWAASGIPFDELMSILIDTALTRGVGMR